MFLICQSNSYLLVFLQIYSLLTALHSACFCMNVQVFVIDIDVSCVCVGGQYSASVTTLSHYIIGPYL